MTTHELPQFPIRIIFDDGLSESIETVEQLTDGRISVDSTDPANGVWVRDAQDRTILLRVDGGFVQMFELEGAPVHAC